MCQQKQLQFKLIYTGRNGHSNSVLAEILTLPEKPPLTRCLNEN